MNKSHHWHQGCKHALAGKRKDKRERTEIHAAEYRRGYQTGLDMRNQGYAQKLSDVFCQL